MMTEIVDANEPTKSKQGVGNDEEPKNVSFFKLFQYSNRSEKCMIVLGALCSVLIGAGDPVLFFLFGDVVNDLSASGPSFTQNINRTAIWFAVLAVIVFVVGFLQMFLLHYSAIRQTKRIRKLYFRAVLRQDIAWFDRQATGTLIAQLSQNIDQIEKGIGSKFGLVLQYLATFIVGVVIGFVKGWKLSLVAIAMLPLNLVAFGVFAFVMKRFFSKELLAYAQAAAIAAEVLGAIRTVVAFGGEEKEHKRYAEKLSDAEKVGIRKSTAIGSATGFLGMVIFASAALIFWYGIKLIIEEGYEDGAVIIIFFNILIGTIAIGSAMPNFEYFAAAKSSAVEIFSTIQRSPEIDKEARGHVLPTVTGRLEFKDVSFTYESRPDIKVSVMSEVSTQHRFRNWRYQIVQAEQFNTYNLTLSIIYIGSQSTQHKGCSRILCGTINPANVSSRQGSVCHHCPK
ncbi:hypothetical protein PHET_08860 [Paragonimus heterotremus]|uniref:ABC transmembrane type-1 domain-containing protein n=1 Tax=Paragonimus heterotremus TaxID=100268 RepID=A0A8J4SZU0_9TREM|nr:hypothetical protein PHET_08860 [Paragonimus heterotremus]